MLEGDEEEKGGALDRHFPPLSSLQKKGMVPSWVGVHLNKEQ